MRNNANPELCVGILADNETLQVATAAAGKRPVTLTFPASKQGVEALSRFLSAQGSSARLAVAGVAALGLALALGRVSGRETYIVSAALSGCAEALVQYAENAV